MASSATTLVVRSDGKLPDRSPLWHAVKDVKAIGRRDANHFGGRGWSNCDMGIFNIAPVDLGHIAADPRHGNRNWAVGCVVFPTLF